MFPTSVRWRASYISSTKIHAVFPINLLDEQITKNLDNSSNTIRAFFYSKNTGHSEVLRNLTDPAGSLGKKHYCSRDTYILYYYSYY